MNKKNAAISNREQLEKAGFLATSEPFFRVWAEIVVQLTPLQLCEEGERPRPTESSPHKVFGPGLKPLIHPSNLQVPVD